MTEEIEKFSPAGEKILSHELTDAIWCNQMDMITLIAKENLELYRISYKNQKVFQVEENARITHSIFSPDGKLCAYFTENSSFKIVKTENGELLYDMKKKSCLANPVTSATWVNYHLVDDIGKINEFKKYQTLNNLIIQLGPHIYSERTNLSKLQYFNDIAEQFTLLIMNDKQGNVMINLNGTYTVAQFNIIDYLPEELKKQCKSVQIIRSFSDSEAEMISFVVSVNVGTDTDKYELQLVNLETCTLGFLKEQITKVGYLLGFVDEHLSYIKSTFNSILLQLKDIQKAFNQRILSSLEEAITKHGITSNPLQELTIYLTTGSYSSALSHFFGKDLFDCQTLRKTDELINSTFANIQEFLLESVLNALERLTVLLTSLENTVSQQGNSAFFGIDASALQKLTTLISYLFVQADKFLNEVTEAKVDMRNLLVWMNKCVIKTAEDTEIENTKNHLSKLSFDIKRLNKIFADEDLFNLKHLFAYFQDGPVPSTNASIDSYKGILSEIQNLSIFETSDSIEDTIRNHSTSLLEEQFKLIGNECFENSQLLNSISKKSKPLASNLGNLFRKHDSQNFKYYLQNIEESWKIICLKPSEHIPKTFQVKTLQRLAKLNSSSIVSYSNQENYSENLEVAFTAEVAKTECILNFTKSLQQEQFSLTLLQLPNNYELKEMIIWQPQNVVVLLTSSKNLIDDKPHSIVGLVDFSSLKNATFEENQLTTDIMSILYENSDKFTINSLVFKKFFRIDSVNVNKLRASLKGLLAVVVDESKMMFFVE